MYRDASLGDRPVFRDRAQEKLLERFFRALHRGLRVTPEGLEPLDARYCSNIKILCVHARVA